MKTLYFLLLLGSTALAQTTQRVSVGTNADSFSIEPTFRITPDGRYVAFTSFAMNLVPGDTNLTYDVFLRDFQSGTNERVSIATSGAQGNAQSGDPSITPDGRYVAFHSDATNLVAGDTNGVVDVFVRDRFNGTTELVSVGVNGAPGNSGSVEASISADGRYVAFKSSASNLVAGDANGQGDIFVRDRLNGTTELVSVATGGAQGNSSSATPVISVDGRYVAFMSYASNLVPVDTNGKFDLFLRDRQLGTTERVNVATGGAQSDGDDIEGVAIASISSDGRYVAFASYASNLVTNDTNSGADVFLRDRQLGTTELVSVSSSGMQGNHSSVGISMSADGRYIAFDSDADNLVLGDTNSVRDVFVRDLQLGTTELVSVSASGVQGDSNSYGPAISMDGRYVAFESFATTLLPCDWLGVGALRRDRQLGIIQLAQVASIEGDSFSDQPSISADGRSVAFRTNASNMDHNGSPYYDVFVYDRPSFSLGLASESTAHAPSNGPSAFPVLSSDGRFVAFESDATNLVPGDHNGFRDIFVHDCQERTTERVSLAFDGAEGNFSSQQASISADGRYVAFASGASNLVAGDTNGVSDIYVRDRQSSTTERVSVATGGVQANDLCVSPSISADGRYVAFMSWATNLVAGDTNGAADIFVHDRQTGTTERVNLAFNGAEANFYSYGRPSISANGRFVAFDSVATNLVPGSDTNNGRDVFVRDRVNGTTERMSVSTSGVQGNDESWAASISGDGRYVSFQSAATNLVAGDTNNGWDIFVHDRLTGITERASIASDGTQANSIYGSEGASISSDGRLVAFASLATNLVANDTNGWEDVFVRDRGAASAFSSFCFGDGSGAACPCANNGNPGHGCQNSAGTGGAVLTAAGGASLSLDTVVLTSTSELPTATSIVLQGTSSVSPAIFGSGLRCAGGSLKRLYTKHAVGGVMTAPQIGDPSISARSSASGDTIPLGATRIYQVYYRDSNLTFCQGGFNVTNAIAVAWGA